MRSGGAALLLSAAGGAGGCTYFEVRAEGLPTVLANTLEWFQIGDPGPWKLAVHQRGEAWTPSCAGGDGWAGALGYVSMDRPGADQFGRSGNTMNEAGLSVSDHALRGVATYAPPNATSARCAGDFAAWAAGTFRTVTELRAALPSVSVLFQGAGTNSAPGSMYAVADAEGGSVVVDFSGGALHMHNNTVGVLANDPDFPWQLRNLNNYVALKSSWPTASFGIDTEVGTVPTPVGHGQNLLGLPGDLSPPSRFVRSFFLREYAMRGAPPASLGDSLTIATGVLNSMHIAKGYNAKLDAEAGWDHTQFSTLKVPAARLFFFRTYGDMQWRRVNLSAVNWDRAGAASTGDGFAWRDVTNEL